MFIISYRHQSRFGSRQSLVRFPLKERAWKKVESVAVEPVTDMREITTQNNQISASQCPGMH